MKYVHHDGSGRCTELIETSDHGTAFIPNPEDVLVPDSVDEHSLPSLIVRGTDVYTRDKLPDQFTKTTMRADLVDTTRLDHVPVGTVVDIGEVGSFEINDGEVELAFSEPGDYKVAVDPFPFRPFEETIHAD